MEGLFKKIEINEKLAEEIINTLNFDEIPNFGDVMSLDEFIDYTKSGCLIDYDGTGDLIIDNKRVTNSVSWIFDNSFKVGNNYIIKFESLKEIFGDRVKVIWFNR